MGEGLEIARGWTGSPNVIISPTSLPFQAREAAGMCMFWMAERGCVCVCFFFFQSDILDR